jgi:DNA-binding response OmpR family regulator
VTTTLLGVDDSKTMRKVIEITFGGEDFKTVLAENADDAMSKLGAERPSIVLVDAALEGTNGYELCQRIKAAAPSVGVLLLSSKQQPYDRNRGTQVGADDFVDKPFDTQQLIDKVSALARKLAGGTQSHPLASTQHGIGGPTAPPPAAAPQAVVSARPASLDLGARPRSPTLAYGNVNPMVASGPGPVAPMIPSPSATRPTQAASPAPAPVAPAPAPAPITRPVAPQMQAPAAAPAPFTPAAAPPPPPAAAPIAAATAAATNGADFAHRLGALGLTRDQITAVLALSREVVEKVVWEVVPTLAETMIKEEIKRLTAE